MDYYELLGVSRDSSQEAIKRAFHSHVRVTHPDVNQGSASAGQETRRLIEAYRTLSNPRTKRQYDLFTTPIASETPAVVPIKQAAHYPSPAPSINKGWLLLALVAVVIGFAVHTNHQNDRLVFRPFLVNGELPSAVSANPSPLLVEPNPIENIEWYHTQQYLMSASNPWTTQQMISAYRQAAERAESQGDAVRAEFYNTAVENVSRLYL